MTLLCSRKELKLIVPRGGAAVGSLQGRRLLLVAHGAAIAKGLMMKPVVAKEAAAGHALGEEDKREVVTGPNPLHNRR
ncbi:hypothetical protein C2845_PM01G16020 [Panicum miliaceum]|uniref:Uncharacterized protein n=1 Tax=Panicum miliaceum TaxID=4540 RepID=A0A3L6TM28_PANMI|nr:hypothetical protein C2845_PM01G16020 [Panicum miliaceum]